MNKLTTNFRSNLKLRANTLYTTNRIDVEAVYRRVESRLQRIDSKFPYLSDKQRVIFINNILIFACTDKLIAESTTNQNLNMSDALIREVIDTDEYRLEHMYPSISEGIND